jgi:GNAT superfamily N-acetyltransferase
MDGKVRIRQARGRKDMAVVRGLMAEYLTWHHSRYAAYRDLIDRHFDHDGYASEMAGLPGEYGHPRGRILLARNGEVAVGMIALRPLPSGEAEMRRLFVTEAAQGRGIGKALARRIMDRAVGLGYRRMRLDTGPLQAEAIALYESLGFIRSEPHYPLPEPLREVMVFMACDLPPRA